MKPMQYRKLPHGREAVSIIGLETSSIQATSEQEIEETIRYALERASTILIWPLLRRNILRLMGGCFQTTGIRHISRSILARMILYRRCQKEGIGISVMKAFSGGQLLDAKTSPFGQALT